MFKFSIRRSLVMVLAVGLFAASTLLTSANHSWGSYHWARSSNPINLILFDNVTSAWDQYLAEASADWSSSQVLNTSIAPGSANPKTCKAVSGAIQVCNARYGNNGWLGIASIWASGNHITQATVKLNDTYFNTARYNTPSWRRFVTCQEVGHTFGLDHQDENFTNLNLGSCMDYTNDPSGTAGTNGTANNEHPNSHDYQQLSSIYSHTDGAAAAAPTSEPPPAMNDIDIDGPGQWGRLVRSSENGLVELYELDFGNGHKVITIVTWTLESRRR
ncbi:MAG: hypothetical protein AB1757_26570 [Acidobacteriota bacterium]